MSFRQIRSGLIVPDHIEDRPKGIDLFAGCGGFSLGMIQGGFEVVAAVEIDPSAAITYMSNLGTYPIKLIALEESDAQRLEKTLRRSWRKDKVSIGAVSGSNRPPSLPGVGCFVFGDVRKIKGADLLAAVGLERGELDCLFGGPPCQGFSHAGRRNVMDPRNSLVFEFARLVVEMKPRTFVLENVPGMVSMVTERGISVIDEFCMRISDGGWATFEALRECLSAQAGVAIQGQRKHKASSRAKVKQKPKTEVAQLGLFGEGKAR